VSTATPPLRPGNRRVTGKEQFYTPPAVADAVLERLLGLRPNLLERTWIEPAGGTGAFVDELQRLGAHEVVSFDIEPHHPAVRRGDFLTQSLDLSEAVAVGNPPFGRNNALSVPFFNACARYCEVVCFIVPRSWRKWSVSNRLDDRFHLVDDYDLEVDYVDVSGAPVSSRGLLRTAVQTWERRDTRRPRTRVRDGGIVKRASPDEADVALTVFGYSCGTLRTEFPRVRNTTQLFLTLHHPRALEALGAVDYSRFADQTAYTKALSLPEINYLLNDYLFGDPGLVTIPT
jgi:predicted RNA methylase